MYSAALLAEREAWMAAVLREVEVGFEARGLTTERGRGTVTFFDGVAGSMGSCSESRVRAGRRALEARRMKRERP